MIRLLRVIAAVVAGSAVLAVPITAQGVSTTPAATTVTVICPTAYAATSLACVASVRGPTGSTASPAGSVRVTEPTTDTGVFAGQNVPTNYMTNDAPVPNPTQADYTVSARGNGLSQGYPWIVYPTSGPRSLHLEYIPADPTAFAGSSADVNITVQTPPYPLVMTVQPNQVGQIGEQFNIWGAGCRNADGSFGGVWSEFGHFGDDPTLPDSLVFQTGITGAASSSVDGSFQWNIISGPDTTMGTFHGQFYCSTGPITTETDPSISWVGQPFATNLQPLASEVIDASTKATMPNVTVMVFRADGSYTGIKRITDANGSYSLAGLPVQPSSCYKLLAVAAGYNPQWYGGFSDPDSAQTFDVRSAPGVGPTFSLTPMGTGTGTITGHVIDVNGPVAGVNVRLWQQYTQSFIATVTNSNGDYTLSNIPSGYWDLQFAKPDHASLWSPTGTVRSGAGTAIFTLEAAPGTLSPLVALTANAVMSLK